MYKVENLILIREQKKKREQKEEFRVEMLEGKEGKIIEER